MTTNKKVVLGLSGGVDSSVSAYLLKKQGYDVTGVFFIMSDLHPPMVEDAKKCAKFLDIPLIPLDLRDIFTSSVINPFIELYNKGLTPNPCTLCNPNVKFNTLLSYANEHNIDHIATGHYADLINKDGRYTLKTPKSEKKDQTYMLYGLSQEVLSKIIFPLSGYIKEDVRKLAKEIGLFTADKPDSQDICFVKDNDYAGYIENSYGQSKIGNFISPDNKILGQHKGIVHYTVGQRKGLGVALGKPCFIKKINGDTGDIHLAFEGDNLTSSITVKNINYVYLEDITDPIDIYVKIRSTAKPVLSTVSKIDSDKLLVKFKNLEKIPSAGQAAVFYKDNLLVAGGIIE
ncbi:MAG: tRNA 2-thiouridine(34) synthase MnmA [Oscillospiraceae bacterium]